MSSYLPEQLRSSWENIETLEKAIVHALFMKTEAPRDSVIIDHKVKILIEQIQNKSVDVLMILNDNDSSKKDEISILSGAKHHSSNTEKSRQPDVWSNFYDRLRDIKEYHKKFTPSQLATPTGDPKHSYDNAFGPPYKEPYFSAEEANEFNNLRKLKLADEYKIGDYLWYIQNFDQFHEIPLNLKEKEYRKYKRYLKNLVEYLKDFFKRTQPLTDFNILEAQIKEDFEYRWKEGTVRGWEKKEEVRERDHLYCLPCQKQFVNPNVYFSHISGKKHKKNEKLTQENLTKASVAHEEGGAHASNHQGEKKGSESKEEVNKKELGFLENYIVRLKENLGDIIHDTTNQIRKKQSRTYEEMEAENYEVSEIEDDKSDSDEEGPIYNPKNLPLGWDGRPIPYWLYKLHGLGIEYKCEICGNYSYWGRRAFERHFQEWRHSYGMKCLRIPNTIHFKEITVINDALALHQKLLLESEANQFKSELEEEFEDSEGNILNKKMYLDLKRQGLL